MQNPSATSISLSLGNNIDIYANQFNSPLIGIFMNKSSPYVAYNTFTGGNPPQSGISINNSYAPTINNNSMTDYQLGIDLLNSSPTMYHNTIINNQNVGVIRVIQAQCQSFPRLSPLQNGNTVWDAGKNTLRSNAQGFQILLNSRSVPFIDLGCNTIFGYNIGNPYVAYYRVAMTLSFLHHLHGLTISDAIFGFMTLFLKILQLIMQQL